MQSDRIVEEWQSVIEHVEQVASQHQKALVHSICDMYSENNDGAEPSVADIKQVFAEEARNEPLCRIFLLHVRNIRSDVA